MRRTLVGILLVMALVVVPAGSAFAQTTADVTVTATPAFISISVSPTSYDFGVVTAGSEPSTATNHFTVTNNSNVATNHSIGVTSATWTGGIDWNHSDAGTAGANIAALKANKGGTWGNGDVIVKYATPLNNIATDQSAGTGYQFGLKLLAPTSFSDGVQKTNTVRITATAA